MPITALPTEIVSLVLAACMLLTLAGCSMRLASITVLVAGTHGGGAEEELV